ncbi:hypothetical protein NKH77_36875 [Streptomyces sp. M19]
MHRLPAVRVRQRGGHPHLGASTGEAQEKAGIAVARSVRLALAGELVPDAVNVQGGVIAEDVKPALPLAEKLGRIFTALAGEVAVRLDVEVYGEITQHDVKVLELSAIKGVFEDIVDETVSYVNAPLFAQERGVEVRLTTSSESNEHRNVVTVRGTLSDGQEVSISGTLAGPKHLQKIVAVGEYDVDLALADHMAFFHYVDRPGVVGQLGRVLGEGHQHRRHAGLACRGGRCGAGGADRGRHHSAGRAHRDRRGDRRHLGPFGQPGGLTRRTGSRLRARPRFGGAGPVVPGTPGATWGHGRSHVFNER